MIPPSTGSSKVQLEDDIYSGTIEKIADFYADDNGVQVEPGTPGARRVNRVYVSLGSISPTGEDVTLSKRLNVTLNPSQAGPSKFSKFLEAATGIPAGDDRQKSIDTDTLIGKPIRVATEFNAQSGYTNIIKFGKAATGAKKAESKSKVQEQRPITESDLPF